MIRDALRLLAALPAAQFADQVRTATVHARRALHELDSGSMATSLADLLDLTTAHARGLTPTADVCADVASAMRYYGTALDAAPSPNPRTPPVATRDLGRRVRPLRRQHPPARQRLGRARRRHRGHHRGAVPGADRRQADGRSRSRSPTPPSISPPSPTAPPRCGISPLSARARQLTRRLADTQHLAAPHPPNADAHRHP